jgi:hypothetical protein
MKNCSLNYKFMTGWGFCDGLVTGTNDGLFISNTARDGYDGKNYTLYVRTRIHNGSLLLCIYVLFNNSFLLKNGVIPVIKWFRTVFNLSFLAVTCRHYFLYPSRAVRDSIKNSINVHDGVKA